ncbi:MAG TPA: hypothetical protein VJX67_13895 [Blastocatellia bacterium]|nr:hypothetical protein [Blastocatellia bacterium]
MADDEGFQTKSIRLPVELWAALESDADRCSRSSTKQMEAILKTYYRAGGVELRDLGPVRDRVSPGLETEGLEAGGLASGGGRLEAGGLVSGAGRVQDHSASQAALFADKLTTGRTPRKNARDRKKDIEDVRRDARERVAKRKAGVK